MDTRRAGSKQSEAPFLYTRLRAHTHIVVKREREKKKKNATGVFTHLKCVDLTCKSTTDRMEFITREFQRVAPRGRRHFATAERRRYSRSPLPPVLRMCIAIE